MGSGQNLDRATFTIRRGGAGKDCGSGRTGGTPVFFSNRRGRLVQISKSIDLLSTTSNPPDPLAIFARLKAQGSSTGFITGEV